jgi:hypothetical protein
MKQKLKSKVIGFFQMVLIWTRTNELKSLGGMII